MSVLCPNCARYVADGKFCPFCGHDLRKRVEEFSLALKSGSVVGDRYVVGEVLGRGEFGVTYSGFDNRANSRVIIIEYLPDGSAKRESGSSTLLPASPEQQAAFDSGKAEFLEDAGGLTELGEDEYRARILESFEQNGTAYCVSEYLGAVDPGEYVPHAFYPEKSDAAPAQVEPIPAVVEFGDREPEPAAPVSAVPPQQDRYFIADRKPQANRHRRSRVGHQSGNRATRRRREKGQERHAGGIHTVSEGHRHSRERVAEAF